MTKTISLSELKLKIDDNIKKLGKDSGWERLFKSNLNVFIKALKSLGVNKIKDTDLVELYNAENYIKLLKGDSIITIDKKEYDTSKISSDIKSELLDDVKNYPGFNKDDFNNSFIKNLSYMTLNLEMYMPEDNYIIAL